MCGITGWVNVAHPLSATDDIVRMTKALGHRGPDDQQIWASSHVQLGHRRLAVIDLEGGRQPMHKSVAQKNYTIVYNGELYNTSEVREELLKRGHTFTTVSDTEVLLTAFIEWKERCMDFINGIFAFAVWDEAEETLYMFRDRLGVKPFFYTQLGEGLLFASEIKGLLAHRQVQPTVDHFGLAALLSLGPSRQPGHAIFKGIHELKPAHGMKYNRDGLKIWRYWDVPVQKHSHSEEETIVMVHDLVTDAVMRQLVSDVPLCTLLSGGLDSSIITAIASKHYETQHKNLHTYSVDYEGNENYFSKNAFQTSQDAYWISIMQQAFKTVHHDVVLQQKDLLALLQEAMRFKDYPSMADIDSSLLLFCREIKKDFTVALSGECADELFGGYPWFHAQTGGFPWIRSIDERQAILRPVWQKRLQLKTFMHDRYEEAKRGMPEFGEDIARQQLFYLNQQFFMQTLLERKDRMSMATGLEVRVPFADHRLVEYVWNIPWEMKCVGGQEKGILRRAFAGVLPKEIIERKKNPYPKTYHPAYTKGVQQLLANALQGESILYELFNKQQLLDLMDSGGKTFGIPWFGQLMAGPQLLAYFVQLHHWFEDYNIQLIE
ncbi:asparagine synthase (glutamine-hydrolyzing) [Solibacillus sp. FSL H8-0538]|uniref:asparagine synthase (glutamine-hydrolyzing) n=1 Tax=Solibacillus sp. FSL H8-0538 TaxID=2921400 RepID=UPI0030F987E4